MLTCLDIKDFAIADRVELDFHNGLSVITGETGAGKSIIIKALGMVLGQRAEPGIVKHGCKRAEIQASFDISDNPAVRELLAAQDLDEESECHLRRVIHVGSSSKAYINGRMVTASMLRTIGEQLIDIHGQHEHQSLLHADTQRDLLDKYAGISEQVQQLKTIHLRLLQHIKQLNKLRQEASSAHQKLDFLQYQVEELSQFAPRVDEWPELYANHQRVHHQAELATFVQNAEQALLGNESGQASLSSQLAHILAQLERAQNIDPGFKDISDLLLEVQTLLVESETSLQHAVESVTFDERELQQIEQRYAEYMEFARKYRVQADQLFETYQTLLSELDRAENPQQNERAQLDEIALLSKRYAKCSGEISRKRTTHARKLSAAISKSMQTLAMEGGEFNIVLQAVTPNLSLTDCATDLSTIGNDTGRESVHFEVSTNAGMPGLALGRVASGGELSRISLAMQIVLSDLSTLNTLVFDEVDVGIGGKTAAIIGKMLAQLATNRQILCITHLPQVAAFGAQHYHVNKQQGKRVKLSLSLLDGEGTIAEIARMVGGEQLTDESCAHARSLIENSREAAA